MITLTADRTTIALPNPIFNDSENLVNDLAIVRTLGGKLFTYIKTKDRKRLVMSLRISFAKSKELRIFLQAYMSRSTIVLRDHIGQHWTGSIMNNPFELEGLIGDDQNIQIIFEGVKT